ncbi:CBM35 domain-containing protein [Streptomyces sp. NPDC091371]|uniref:CBM35 domain-containing protein n=1 Tax=Streptomyces sp. NPDC091371 TaxID=3155303 RepID=UPI003441547D
MTTPANNGPHGGGNQPEDDDPFGYLYADGQAAGAVPPGQGGGYGYPGPAAGGPSGAQPGVPRTSHHQVRTVGERRNGGQRGQVPAQQPAYQAGQYQAPEALQAAGYGVPPQQQPPQHQTQAISHSGGHGHGGGGSSRKGMLIAAVAVVAAVAIGIGVAVAYGDNDKDKGKNNADGNQQTAAPQTASSPPPSSPQPAQSPLPKGEAAGAGMAITGGASLMSAVPGAKSSGGQYVGNFNQPGAAVTWTLDVPKAGTYKFYVRFGIPGEDANGTLTVNGKANSSPISMRNFANSPKGDWEKGWQTTWGQVTLVQGTNTIKLSCEAGNSCNVNIDQLWLQQG